MENNINPYQASLQQEIEALKKENLRLKQEIQQLKQSDNVKNSEKLREVNSLLDTILDNLPLYLFVKDVDNELRYLYWNKAFAAYSKIPASQVIGRTDFEVFPDFNDALKFRNDDMEVIRMGEPISLHETYIAADGKTRMCQTLKTLMPREGHGPLLIGVTWDITNMQNIEQELVQERLRAEEADRLKSRFLANMSHEIRTPLNAIVGFSNLLVVTDEEEERQKYADLINQNSEVLLQLISDILDISKIEAGTLEYVRKPFSLHELCQNIYEIHKDRMQPGVQLCYDNAESDDGIILTEDINRIMQVITNLITNATKFTFDGEIRYGYTVGEDEITVFVKDTGTGIPKEKIGKIFDRFVKLDKFAQGTGLGLSICKMIVNIFNGRIWVESEEGKGSKFSFTIPYVKDKRMNQQSGKKASASDDGKSLKPASDSGRKTILIAEDVPSNVILLQALLGKSFNLIVADNGIDAVKMFHENHPDLILMDIKMPDMDGIAATRMIRTHSKTIPIVALTAYAYDSDRFQAFEAGVNDFLTKPLRQAELDNVLAKYL